MIFSIEELVKLKQMIEVLNFKGDEEMMAIAEKVIAAYRRHRLDIHVEIAGGRIIVRPRDEQSKLPLS